MSELSGFADVRSIPTPYFLMELYSETNWKGQSIRNEPYLRKPRKWIVFQGLGLGLGSNHSWSVWGWLESSDFVVELTREKNYKHDLDHI